MGYYRNERGYPRSGRNHQGRDFDERLDDRGDDQRERGYGRYGGDYRDRPSTPYGGGYDYGRSGYGRTDYGREDRGGWAGRRNAPADYDYDDRGFFTRAGDEVRSWFGDEDAERRRALDARYDERQYGGGGYRDRGNEDRGYSDWRNRQIDALDRDYHEYRRENQSRFDREFGSWRERRSGQRSALQRVSEHMEVVGSDGTHVGTVDQVRGDRIILTKSDKDAGGHHHSIPSAWIESVDDKVTIAKTADEAQHLWRDEEQRGALFGDEDRSRDVEYRYTRGFIGFY